MTRPVVIGIYLLNDVSGFQRLVLLLDVILADENVIDK